MVVGFFWCVRILGNFVSVYTGFLHQCLWLFYDGVCGGRGLLGRSASNERYGLFGYKKKSNLFKNLRLQTMSGC